MNDHARALVADLRALLERHPRARAIDAHAGTWLQVYITAVDDAAVDKLAAELGLGPPAYASHEGVSWYRATLREGDAAITVIGPSCPSPQGGSVTRGSGVGRGWRGAVKAPLRWRRQASAEPPMIAMEAPVTLTAEQVLEAARARGVPAFAGVAGGQRILLGSLGLDLTDSGIRAALVDLHRRGELHLAALDDVGAARADLAARRLPVDLVEDSAVDDGAATFHVVVVVS